MGVEMMKIAVKKLIRDEKGSAMVMALILLLVGGLISAPLLSHMGTGLITGEVYEKRTAELYAADAGVEDAVWRIQTNNLTFDVDNRSYPESLSVNDKSVDVVIYREVIVDTPCYKEYRYQILSNATGTDGSGTKIEAYVTANVTYNDYSGISNQVLTIQKNLTPQELADLINDLKKVTIPCPTGCTECEICGTVYDYNSDDYKNVPEECKSCVVVYNYPSVNWPTADFLSDWYEEKVEAENGTHYYGNKAIDLGGNPLSLESLYVHGDLTINNSKDPQATLTLAGTIYVTGKVLINPTKNMVLDLGGNTIFVDSGSVNPEALYIKGKCAVKGPGALIVRGAIYFEPNITAGTTDPVFMMSVESVSTVKPGVDFYGAIAGNVDVEPYPNTEITYPTGGFGELNFPDLVEDKRSYSIASWEVSQ